MNTAARLVTGTRKFDHITPVLQYRHWHPIESRCKIKILLLVYKCLYGLAPSYWSKRLSLKPNRGLRSDDKLVLNVPITKLKKQKHMVIVVSQLQGPISGINSPVILGSPSKVMFLKGLWRHIFSKMHLTYSFILVMSYIYILYIHILTMHAISISPIFYFLYTF